MAKTVKLAGLRVDLALGIAEFTRGADQAAARANKLQGQLKTAFAGIATAIAVKQISDFSAAIDELAHKGEIAGSIQENFAKLGGSASQIDAAKRATLGLVDSFELMQVANRGLGAGIKGFGENFAQVAELGGKFADAMGTDTKQEIDNLTSALISGSKKGLAPYGFQLEGLKTKAERQAAAMKQLPSVLARFSDLTDSAANAQDAFNKKIGEVEKKVGTVINSSETLTKQWREMGETLDDVDWEQLGRALTTIKSLLLDIAQVALTVGVNIANALANITELNLGDSKAAIATRINIERQDLEKYIAQQTKQRDSFGLSEDGEVKLQEAKTRLAALNLEFTKMKIEAKGAREEGAKIGPAVIPPLEGAGDAADKAGKKVESLREKMAELGRKDQIDSISDALEKAVSSGDQAGFNSLMGEFQRVTAEGIRAGFSDLSSPNDLAELESHITQVTDKATTEWQTKFDAKQKETYKEGVEFWRTTFENAITGTTFNLKDALKQVAVGFAAEMAQAVFGSVGGIFGSIKSPQDFGGAIAQSILGDVFKSSGGTAGILGGLGESLGIGAAVSSAVGSFGTTAASAYAAGISGPATATGMMTPASGMLGALGPWGVAGIAALGIGGAMYGGDIKKALGFGGPSNPETIARREFAGKIEELIKAMGGLQVRGPNGSLSTITDIKTGSSTRFNAPGWADAANKQYGAGKVSAFTGVASVLGEKFGLKDLVGAQGGVMLLESLKGDFDALADLIDAAGMSFQDFSEAMIAQGKKGDESWLSIVSQIRDANEAFKEGINGQAQYAKAADDLFKSQGRGARALKAVANLGIEGAEAGFKTIDQLMNALKASGQMSAVEIEALYHALQENGIKTIEQLKGANDQLKAQVVAATDAYLQDHGGKWREIGEEIDKVKAKADSLNNSKVSLTFDVKSKLDENTKALIDAGADLALPDSDSGMMGDRTPDSVAPAASSQMSTRRFQGRVGRAQTNVINNYVDARGAEVGAEARFYEAMAVVQSNFSEIVAGLL